MADWGTKTGTVQARLRFRALVPSENTMVAAYHLIWTLYGWWLPNDPRGSSSDTIRQDLIAELGELHRGRKKLQPSGRVLREFYDEAKLVLKHELRTLTEEEVQIVA